MLVASDFRLVAHGHEASSLKLLKPRSDIPKPLLKPYALSPSTLKPQPKILSYMIYDISYIIYIYIFFLYILYII